MKPETQRSTTGHDEWRRARLRRSLSEMNVALSPYAFEMALARVTASAQRGVEVTEIQVRAIVDDVVSSSEILQGVAESFR